MTKDDLSLSSEHFYNRELSWVKFNQRVLEEAQDSNNPLLERVNFLGISSSNLDEFFMVRVASLKDQVLAKYNKIDASGLTAKHQLKLLSQAIHKQVTDHYRCWNEQLSPELADKGILFLKPFQLDQEQLEFLDDMFTLDIYPVLTPMAIDQSRPFPFLINKSLNICLMIKKTRIDELSPKEEGEIFAVVQVPSVLNRFIELPPKQGKAFVLLEDVIIAYLHKLFHGYQIISASPFRIIRNLDLPIEEEDAEDLLGKIQQWLKQRQRGTSIRLELAVDTDQRIRDFLQESLHIHKGELYPVDGPLDLSFLMKFSRLPGYKQLRFAKYTPVIPDEFAEYDDIFELIRQGDRLIHHPYESFQPVIDFVTQAANDPQVLAIKQTLYRVSGDSPIIKALAQAAEKGKQVTVVVEIKARFDEENNIQWARKLEEAGCHVIYGLVGLKVHCKLILVVRREDDGIRRYLHLGTGNYNDITAKVYTDMGLFTCDQYLGADVSALFNMLTGYSKLDRWYKLGVAPVDLRSKFVQLINQEIQSAQNGSTGYIIAKMNSLVDPDMISHLYRASQAGVKIDLIVRGICSLIPGLPGISDNIRVISIVGRFLEHTRIFYFHNNDFPQLFLGSADWMPRNLDRRVEIIFPIQDEKIKERIIKILYIYLQDNVKARELTPDGGYKRKVSAGAKDINVQELLMNKTRDKKTEI